MTDKPFIGSKLVRDWVPTLEHDPICTSFRVAEPDEMPQLLYAKFIEELQEAMKARKEPYPAIVDELADVYQVFRSLCDEFKIDFEVEVLPSFQNKLALRGSFSGRYVMRVQQ